MSRNDKVSPTNVDLSNLQLESPLQTVAGQVTQDAVAAEAKAVAEKKPPREYTPEEKARLEKVKKIMFDLSKTVRSYTLYNQNNEAIRKFIQNLFEGLTAYLHEETVLSLRIKADAIFFEEDLVYENANREESIAVKLFKDGVKEIVLQEGLEKKELVDFIDILNVNLDQPEYYDEDVVSLMWERDFENISYFVIEGFSDDIDPQKKAEFEEDIDLILSLVYSDKPPDRALKSARLSKEDIYQYFKSDSLSDDVEESLQEIEDFKSHFSISKQEVANLQKEIDAVSDADMIFQMVEIIIEILAKESDHDSFLKIGDVLIQIMDMLLLRADFSNATRIIKKLREIVIASGTYNEDDDMSTESAIVKQEHHGNIRLGTWIEEIIEKIGEEQRIEQVVAALNQGFKGKPSKIFDYIISLNNTAVNAIINLLGEVNHLTHRRLICDAVLIIHDGDITKFAQKLYDERWFVVSDMLYILGKVGNADALSYMMKAYEHDNPRVRAEAIGALRRFPAEKVRDVYVHALRDNNLQVQLQALRALAQAKDHAAVDQILEVVEDRDFMNFPITAKKRFFMTLVMIEGEQLSKYFAKTLSKNKFWLGSFNTEMRVCSAFALGIVGNALAKKVLERNMKSWNRQVRDACREAFHRTRMSGSSGGDLILEPLADNQTSGNSGLILEPIKK